MISSFEAPKFTQNVVTEFEWEVKGLNEQMSTSALNQSRLESPCFGIQGTENRDIYRGKGSQVKVWLRFEGKDSSRYMLQIRAVDHYSIVVDTKLSCGSHQMTTKETFSHTGLCFGKLLVILRDTDIGRAIAEHNAISVLVRVTTVSALGQPTNTQVEQSALVVPPTSTLASNLLVGLTSADFADITLNSKCGDSFQAHRQLLAMRSPVFSAMFYGQMREAGSGIACIGASSGTVQHFLKFIYTDEVEGEAVETSGSELYELAVQYELPRLAELVKEQFFRTLSVDNVCERLTLAVRFTLEELEKRCKMIIKGNIAAVMDTKGWLHVARDAAVMRMLMSCDSSPDDHGVLSPRKVKRPRLESSQPSFP